MITSLGAASTFVTAAYSGSGNTAIVTFTINTASPQPLQSYYLRCQVPAQTSTVSTVASAAINVQSSYTI